MTRGPSRLDGTTSDESAHAVAQQHQALDPMRPSRGELFQLLRERFPVGREVQPCVVVQVDRRVAKVTRQRGAVIVPVARPLQIVHAQTVYQYEQPAIDVWNGSLQRSRFELQRVAIASKTHRGGERIARGGEVVTQHAVQCGNDRLAVSAGIVRSERGA